MNTFKKEERLCSKLIIDKLFSSGSSFLLYPFRVHILPIECELATPYRIQILLVAPKKKFKKAVDRNLLKRRMRELYRIHKCNLYQNLPSHSTLYAIAFSYVGKEIHAYAMMEGKFLKICETISKKYFVQDDVS